VADVTFTVKPGKTLWAGVDYSNPSAAYLLGSGGEEVVLDDASDAYAEVVASARLYVASAITVPAGDFSADVTSGEAPLEVTFSNEMTGSTWWAGQFVDEGVGTVTWAWDFGDTGTSTDENPVHEYEDAGTYTVVLTATNTVGLDDEEGVVTKTAYIVVSEP
jgi:PKD repeat protein